MALVSGLASTGTRVILSRARLQLRQVAVVGAIAAVVAPIFNLLTSAPTLHEAIQGVVDAVLISALVGAYVIVLRDG